MARLTLRTASVLSIFGLALFVGVNASINQAIALPANKISQLAKKFTVLVHSESPGTGVILNKTGSTYTVLTAAHVVEYSDYEYTVHTPDEAKYPIEYKTVKKLPGIDLAIFEFRSDRTYPTAQLADSDATVEGSPVYIAGFPDPGTATVNRIFQFTSGEISSRPNKGPKGYLMHYTNITRVGMSGGPVLNNDGKLVGIHGLANTDQESGNKTGINLGIPINSFLDLSPKIGFTFPSLVAKPSKVIQEVVESVTPKSFETKPALSTPSISKPQNPSRVPFRVKPLRPGKSFSSPVCAGLSC